MMGAFIILTITLAVELAPTDWTVKKEELTAANEGGAAYSSSVYPAGWQAKVASHTPSVALVGDQATISVSHSLASDHFITAVWAVDQASQVIFWHSFASSDATASVTFTLPVGVTTVTAYEHCNLHGVWVGSTITVSAGVRAEPEVELSPVPEAVLAKECSCSESAAIVLVHPGRRLSWEFEDNMTVLFTVRLLRADGFVGFGIKPTNAAQMKGADIVVVRRVGGGEFEVEDRYGIAAGGKPDLDTECGDGGGSHVELVSTQTLETGSAVQVRRLIDTGDPYDVPIRDETQTVIFAFGNGAFEYHGSNNGELKVNFYEQLRAQPEIHQAGTGKTSMLIKIIHGSVMSSLWGTLTLVGVAAARLRNVIPSFLIVHKVLMGVSAIMTIPLVILVKQAQLSGHSAHSRLGLAIVVATVVQAGLGIIASLTRKAWADSRLVSVTKMIHKPCGYVLSCLAVCQIYLGLRRFNMLYSPGEMIERQTHSFFVVWLAMVLLFGLAIQWIQWKSKHATKHTAVCFEKTGLPVELMPVKATEFHLFLSHRQNLGQDQVAIIKSRLLALVPTMSIFLDVDTLDDIQVGADSA
jgi:desulfoferrodoxin (superoxide reductase-like protein)